MALTRLDGVFGGSGGRCLGLLLSDEADGFAHLAFHTHGDFFVLLEKRARILAALADAIAFVAVPRARFLDQVVLHGDVEHVALARNTFAIEDVELRLAEGRGNLVLYYLYLGAGADDGITIFERGDAANVHAD